MLSTSFIVARQPARSRQEGFSRNSVNSPNLAQYEQESAESWIGRGRERVYQTQERNYHNKDRTAARAKDTSQTRETSVKKLVRSLSMSKRGDTIRNPGGKVQAKPGRSMSQTRDPQQTLDRDYQNRNNDNFRNLSIRENVEGATKFGYKYNHSSYGTIGRDASSIFAIQSRPLPNPGGGEVGKKQAEKSLYENINR